MLHCNSLKTPGSKKYNYFKHALRRKWFLKSFNFFFITTTYFTNLTIFLINFYAELDLVIITQLCFDKPSFYIYFNSSFAIFSRSVTCQIKSNHKFQGWPITPVIKCQVKYCLGIIIQGDFFFLIANIGFGRNILTRI